jgi:hypothetical protein
MDHLNLAGTWTQSHGVELPSLEPGIGVECRGLPGLDEHVRPGEPI